MPPDLSALDRNGVAEAAGALAASEDCLERLTRLSALSGALSGLKQGCAVDLAAPKADATAALGQLARTLEAGGASALRRSLPVGGSSLASLSHLSLAASALGNVKRTLGVDLMKPDAERLLAARLAAFSAKPPQLPRLPAADLARLTRLGAATGSLRAGLGIDLLQPGAALKLTTALGQMRTSGLFASLRALPFRAPALAGLGQLSVLAMGLQALKQVLGLDLLAAGAASKLAQLTKSLGAGSALASLLSRAVAGGLGGSAALRMPDFAQISHLSSSLAAVKMAQLHLGLNLLAPDAGARLKGVLAALHKNGACKAVEDLPLKAAEMEGASRLQSVATTIGSARSGMGVDLMQKAPPAKLQVAVQGLQKGGAPQAIPSAPVPPAVLDGLSTLSMLGSVTEGLQSKGRA